MDDCWLALKIRERKGFAGRSKKPQVFICIAKKVIPLAVARNRLKRLIREAIRKDDFFQDTKKVYSLMVLKGIKSLKTNDVRQTLAGLK